MAWDKIIFFMTQMVFGATNMGFKHTDWMFTPWKILKTGERSPNYGVVRFFFGGEHVGAKASESRYHPKSQASQQNHAAISHQIIDLPPSPSSLSFAAGHCERGRHLRFVVAWALRTGVPPLSGETESRRQLCDWVIRTCFALSVFVGVSKQEIYQKFMA